MFPIILQRTGIRFTREDEGDVRNGPPAREAAEEPPERATSYPAPRSTTSRLPSLPKEQILSLAQGDFLRRQENLVLLGNSGTGKTHVAIGIAASCVAAGYSVRFTTALTLAQELLLAQDEHRLPRVLKSYDRYDLVVVDELGYLGLCPGGAPLFQFFAKAVRAKERLHHHKPGVRPLARDLRRRHPDRGGHHHAHTLL